MCKAEEEDREHYEYGCKKIEELRRRVEQEVGRQAPLTQEEWNLEKEVEEDTMIMIAVARWIYHCARCKMDKEQQRRMNIELIMMKVNRRIQIVKDAKNK